MDHFTRTYVVLPSPIQNKYLGGISKAQIAAAAIYFVVFPPSCKESLHWIDSLIAINRKVFLDSLYQYLSHVFCIKEDSTFAISHVVFPFSFKLQQTILIEQLTLAMSSVVFPFSFKLQRTILIEQLTLAMSFVTFQISFVFCSVFVFYRSESFSLLKIVFLFAKACVQKMKRIINNVFVFTCK